jgi:hypothetical protein
MRKIPQMQIVPTIASNVLLKRFAQHPLTRLRKTGMDQRRLAEFMQIIQQLLFPKSVDAKPCISFGKPFSLEELEGYGYQRRLMPAVLARVKDQLAHHLEVFEQNHTSTSSV